MMPQRETARRRIREEQERTLEIAALTGSEVSDWFMNLPALRGLWAAGSADAGGGMYDRSGQSRHLTYNGNPTLNIHNSLVPYWDYDGTGDFHSRTDEAGLDVLGTETYVASSIRGLTLGAWCWTDTALADQSIAGKWNGTGNQRAYVLNWNTTNNISGSVSLDGTAVVTVTSTVTTAISGWYFSVLRLTPSTELALFVNGVETDNTTSIPASIFANTADFQIAARNAGTVVLNGRVALTFLCAAALPDELLTYLFERTRGAFGV